jgi:hypothetical protein
MVYVYYKNVAACETARCPDKTCVKEHKRCNGYPDCSDNKDEQNCSKTA